MTTAQSGIAGPGGGRRARLADVCALVPRILAAEAESLPRRNGRPGIAKAKLTDTGRAVVLLASAGEPPSVVVKLPLTADARRGLELEARTLAALHADDRLGAWRRLLPLPLAKGTVLGQPYRLESVLTGCAISRRVGDQARRRVVREAAEVIHALHRTTMTVASCDARVREHWIDARVDDLARRGACRHPRLQSRFDRLRAELHDAVSNRRFSTSWIHGDYWLGNLLLSPDSPTVEGIIDWDAAGSKELAIHDLLHLILYTRRLRTGRELGEMIRGQLLGKPWSPSEHHLLERYGAWCHDGSLSNRHAVLLYWLRHAAFHARQQTGSPGYRYRIWELRNVQPVLAAL